ncbi:MAG: hypothetical protein WAM79_11935 [Candidatus Sulfotelmatobacter sp.]
MKKLALLALVLELAVCGCGTTPSSGVVTTTTNGNWEAQFLGGTPASGALFAASQLNFVTSFAVTSVVEGTPEELDINGFGFFNAGQCFSTGLTAVTTTGSATLNTAQSGQVTGSLTYTVTSVAAPGTAAGNVLVLSTTPSGGVSGTSNGTSTTTGTLSNGIAWGTWSLQSKDSTCLGGATGPITGTFIMCQGTATCTPP